MTKIVVLDTGTLGMATHPSPNAEFSKWFKSVLKAKIEVCVPEICDYELRRELIRIDSTDSLSKLDALNMALGYLPIDTAVMRLAAQFWAKLRAEGPRPGNDLGIDGDVILAAQTKQLEDSGFKPVIATDNVRHLTKLTTAKSWKNLVVGQEL